jgi:hypothetical protein
MPKAMTVPAVLLCLTGPTFAGDACDALGQAMEAVAEQYANVVAEGGKRNLGLALIAMESAAAKPAAEAAGWEPELIAALDDLIAVPALANNGKDRFEDVGPPKIRAALAAIADLAPAHCPDIAVPALP